MSSPAQTAGVKSEAATLREELQRSQETVRRLTGENENFKEELKRRQGMLEKNEATLAAQARRLEAAEQKIRELVRSEGEADYKCRTLAGKVAAAERSLAEALGARRALEKKLQNREQQMSEVAAQSKKQEELLQSLRSTSEKKAQSAESLDQQNRDLEAKLSRAVSQLRLFQGKTETLQRSVLDRETELALVQQNLEILTRERDHLKKELDEARSQSKGYRDGQSELERNLSDADRQLHEVTAELTQLKGLYEKTDKTRRELIGQLEALQSEQRQTLTELQVEREESTRTFETMERLQNDLEASRRELDQVHTAGSAQIVKLQDRLKEAERDFEGERVVVKELRAQLSKTKDDVVLKSQQLGELSRWAERVKPAYDALKERFGELQTELTQRKAELANLEEVLAGERSDREHLQTRLQSVESDFESVTLEREQLVRTVEELTASGKAKDSTLAEMQERINALNGELQTEQSDRSRLQGELENSSQKVQALLQRETELKDKLQDLIQERETLAEESKILLASESAKIRQLTEELEAQTSANNKSQKNLKELLKQRQQLLDSLKSTQQQVAAGEQSAQESEKRIIALEAERDKLLQALDEVRRELERTVASWRERTEALGRQLEENQQANEELRGQLEAERSEVAELRREHAEALSSLEENVRELTESKQALTSQVEELSRDLADTQGSLSDMIQKFDAEHNRALRLQAELDQVSAEGQEFLAQRLDLEAKIETLDSELKARQEESTYQIEERVKLEEQIGELLTHKHGLSEQLARSQREALGLREYLEKYQKVSKERIEQARTALEERNQQLRSYHESLVQKTERVQVLESALVRYKQTEKALKGAIIDLRSQIHTQSTMVEELEWHLRLVYENLEAGELEIEEHREETAAVRQSLQEARDALEFELGQKASLEQALEALTTRGQDLTHELGELRLEHQKNLENIQKQSEENRLLQRKLESMAARLGQTEVDLGDEQLRSAALGAQLLDALKTRNRMTERLRKIQLEFERWREDVLRDSGLTPELPGRLSEGSELGELEEQLSLSQARELELSQTLERFLQGQPIDSSHSDLVGLLDYGFDLGAELSSAKIELYRWQGKSRQLSERTAEAAGMQPDDELKSELSDVEREVLEAEQRHEQLTRLWIEFEEGLSEEARSLMHKFSQILNAELESARQSLSGLEDLKKQLAASEHRRRLDYDSLEKRLDEKDQIIDELEDGLVELAETRLESDDLTGGVDDLPEFLEVLPGTEIAGLGHEEPAEGEFPTIEDLPPVPLLADEKTASKKEPKPSGEVKELQPDLQPASDADLEPT